ncbi:MAG: Gfo/Idh/MocA family oxidoreductase [Planctomycetaceae bacterium]
MNAFQVASQTVLAALETGQAGRPVAVRVTAQLGADHGRIERLTARILNAVGEWFDSRPERLTAFGAVETGHISTLICFAAGQSALVSVGCCISAQPMLELIVWGDRGILSWEHDCGFGTDDDEPEPNLSDVETLIFEHLQASLRSGQSIRFDGRRPTASGRRKLNPSDAGQQPAIAASKLQAQRPPWGVLLVAGDHTHQPQYADSLAKDPRCRLIGVTDEDNITPRRRRLNHQLADRLSIPVLPDLQQALRRDDVHIVSICAEPIRRGRIIVQAAQAGKHLYLDKPLAATLEEADAIRDAVRAAGVVSHMWSFAR